MVAILSELSVISITRKDKILPSGHMKKNAPKRAFQADLLHKLTMYFIVHAGHF